MNFEEILTSPCKSMDVNGKTTTISAWRLFQSNLMNDNAAFSNFGSYTNWFFFLFRNGIIDRVVGKPTCFYLKLEIYQAKLWSLFSCMSIFLPNCSNCYLFHRPQSATLTLYFNLILEGEGINQKKLDIRTLPFTHTNRGYRSYNGRKSPLS